MDEKYSILGTTLKGIADAIRRKTGKTGGLVPENMEAEIDSVKTFDDLPELSNPAGASQILSGYEAILEDGTKVTGTIASQAAQTITPGTSNKTIAAGKYLSGVQTIKGDSNLIAANILKGKSIFGVSGSAISPITGSFTANYNSNQVTVPELKGKTRVMFVGYSTATVTVSSFLVYVLAGYIDGVNNKGISLNTSGATCYDLSFDSATGTLTTANMYASNLTYNYIAW